jgi:hypothetical protein
VRSIEPAPDEEGGSSGGFTRVTWEEASSLISVSMASRVAFDGRRVDYPTLPESEIYPDQA